MAVILSKGARGIRRLFMDYIVWQAECETAHFLNLLKVISWLIFLRANLATSKGTPHLHVLQKKWIFSSHFDYHNVIRRFRGILKHFQGLLDGWRIWSAVFLSLVVDNCSWNLCSECCQMFFGCGLNKAVTRTHRYVEISWRHVLMNAYHVIFVVIIIIISVDIFGYLNDLNVLFTWLILNVLNMCKYFRWLLYLVSIVFCLELDMDIVLLNLSE